MTASRLNANKPQMHYLTDLMPALVELVRVFEMGALKYGSDNWKEGFEKDVLLDSALRHIFKSGYGESLDNESGLNHLAHAAWNILVLLQQEIKKS